MKTNASTGGFSRADLIMALGALGLLMALVFPALSMQRLRSDQVACSANLHRLGLGAQAFSDSHGGQFPFRLARAAGGSSGGTVVAGHLAALSNYVDSPRILACPASGRLPAASFSAVKDANVSYGLWTHVMADKQRAILAGDFDINGGTIGACSFIGRVEVSVFNGTAGQPDTFNPASWSATNHVSAGNLLWSDGSVSSGDSRMLRVALSRSLLEGDTVVHILSPK